MNLRLVSWLWLVCWLMLLVLLVRCGCSCSRCRCVCSFGGNVRVVVVFMCGLIWEWYGL